MANSWLGYYIYDIFDVHGDIAVNNFHLLIFMYVSEKFHSLIYGKVTIYLIYIFAVKGDIAILFLF